MEPRLLIPLVSDSASFELDLDNIGTDFTFTRASSATYVDVNDTIEAIKPLEDDLTPFDYYNINNSPLFNLATDGEWSWKSFSYAQSGYKLAKDNVTNGSAACDFFITYDGIETELYFTFYFNPDAYLAGGGNESYLILYRQYTQGTQAITSTPYKFYALNNSTKNVGDLTSDAYGYLEITDSIDYSGTTYNKAVVKFDLDALGLTGADGAFWFNLTSRGQIIEHEFFDIYATHNIEFISKEYYNTNLTLDYINGNNYNLANASMRGDIRSISLDNITQSNISLYSSIDKGGCAVEATSTNGYENTEYGLVKPEFKGYGLKTPVGVGLYFGCTEESAMTFGFWLNKTLLNGNDISLADQGSSQVIAYERLIKGAWIHLWQNVDSFYITEEKTVDSE